METLAELREHVQGVIAGIGEGFTEPDDDWMPIACLDGEDGLILIGLAGDLFADGLRKDALALFLKQAMVQFKARRYALLLNTHMRAVDPDEYEQIASEHKRVQEFEGAEEILVLVVGDAEQEDCVMAKIERDGISPPTLMEWKEPQGWGGRFSGLNEQMSRITI